MWPLFLLLACRAPEPEPEPTPTHDTLAVATSIADNAADFWSPDAIGPGWIQTVYAYGWHRLHAASEEPDHFAYYRAWMDDQLPEYEGGREFNSSDSMAMSSMASILMIEDDSLDYGPVLQAADDYLASAPRLESGAIAHWGIEDSSLYPTDQIWIDSQFMFGMYLLREYERTGDTAYHDLFVEQYILFSELCRHESDLYFHAWDDSPGETIPTEPVFWTRGNSWVLIAAAEYLLITGDQADPRIAPLFESHAAAFLPLQEEGLWRTVANDPYDDPDNYFEVSGSALVAYALQRGIEAGVLDEATYRPMVSDAVEGVMDSLRESGDSYVVTGTSAGTNPGDYDNYVSVPTIDDQMLGIGAVMVFLAEAHGEPIR